MRFLVALNLTPEICSIRGLPGSVFFRESVMQCLLFQIGKMTCALAESTLVEIRRLGALQPPITRGDGVMGVVPYRGLLLAVYDLSLFLGSSPCAASPRDLLVVAQAGDRTVGWPVDRLLGYGRIDDRDVRLSDPFTLGRRTVPGISRFPDGTAWVVDVGRLLFTRDVSGGTRRSFDEGLNHGAESGNSV